MKVICIDNNKLLNNNHSDKIPFLTKGKIYDAKESRIDFQSQMDVYRIIDDNNTVAWHYKYRFTTLRESNLKILNIK